MKNNKITLSQFSFSMFLCSLASLLFIDHKPSLTSFIIIAAALCFNITVVLFCKGNINPVIKCLVFIYLFLISSLVCTEFCHYMYSDLGYGPYWILAVLSLGFAYFSTVKGLEPLNRAAVIIFVFVILSVIYIALSSINGLKFTFKFTQIKSLIIPALLVYPSAVYLLNSDNIIPNKKYTFILTSALSFVIILYFYYLPDNKVAVGIFKGADGLLLAVLAVAMIYSLSYSSVSLFKYSKHRYITNFVFLSGILVFSITAFYSQKLFDTLHNNLLALTLLIIIVISCSVMLIKNYNKK